MSAPRNLTRKLLGDHLLEGDLVLGEEMDLTVDQILIEDATGSMTTLQFEALGADSVAVPLAVMYVDHNVLQIDDKTMDEHRFLQSFSSHYGIQYSRPGNGISHYVHLERFARPGELLVGADSHSTMAGAVGMFAVGAGGLDVAVAMAGGGFLLGEPQIVRGARRGGTGLRVHRRGRFDPLGDGSRHDMQHDHGAGRDRRRLPERRANSPMACHPEARGELHLA